jgi:hypothetical protein
MTKSNKTKPTKPAAPSTPAAPAAPRPKNAVLHWILLAVVLLAYSFFRYGLADMPFERDEGSYGYMGQLLLDGKVAYRDFYEMKPPGLFYGYAVLVGIGGQQLHVAMLFVCLLTAACCYLMGWGLFSRTGGVAAALTYLALSLAEDAGGYTAQAEHLVVLFVAGSLAAMAVAHRRNGWWLWVLAGALLGQAVMTKQVAVLFGAAALGLAWSAGRAWRPALRHALWLAVGGSAVMLGWLALVAAQGTWDEMVFWLVEFPRSYASLFTWAERKNTFWNILGSLWREYPLFWLAGVGGVVLTAALPRYRHLAPVLAFCLLAAVVAVLPGYYFYPHYWLFLALALGLGAAATGGVVAHFFLEKNGTRSATWWPVLLVGGLLLFDVARHRTYYFSPNFKTILRKAYADNPFAESQVIADFLKKKAQPGDELLVMGSEPQINFYTGMRSPTRHLFMGFLTKGHAREATWIAEAKADAERSKPRFLVVAYHPFSWAYTDNSKTEMFDYAFELANQHYNLVGVAELQPNFAPTKYFLGPGEVTKYQRSTNKAMLVYERK